MIADHIEVFNQRVPSDEIEITQKGKAKVIKRGEKILKVARDAANTYCSRRNHHDYY